MHIGLLTKRPITMLYWGYCWCHGWISTRNYSVAVWAKRQYPHNGEIHNFLSNQDQDRGDDSSGIAIHKSQEFLNCLSFKLMEKEKVCSRGSVCETENPVWWMRVLCWGARRQMVWRQVFPKCTTLKQNCFLIITFYGWHVKYYTIYLIQFDWLNTSISELCF